MVHGPGRQLGRTTTTRNEANAARPRLQRFPGRHPSSPAAPGTRVAHEHDGGGGGVAVPAPPTLANVWALCLLAYGAETQLPELGLYLRVLVTARHWRALQPIGLALPLLPRRGRYRVDAAVNYAGVAATTTADAIASVAATVVVVVAAAAAAAGRRRDFPGNAANEVA